MAGPEHRTDDAGAQPHRESDPMTLIVLAAVAAAFLAALIATAVATLAEPGGLASGATETW
jgi:hypothetical protein